MQDSKVSGWKWVPSVYVFQGVPSHLIMSTSVLILTALNYDPASITFWTGIVSLPWSFKPLWAPIVERTQTLRSWVVQTEALLCLAIALLALSFFCGISVYWSLGVMFLVALLSATHDIACDGYYMSALDVKDQRFFVGIRSSFYRVAMVAAGGLLPWVACHVADYRGSNVDGWSFGLLATALLLLLLALVNRVSMPRVHEKHGRQDNSLKILFRALKSFFSHPGALPFVLFFLSYRLGEAQLSKMVPVFMVASRDSGGLGLDLADYGIIYGTAGVIALTVGGILGGFVASRYGLRRSLWPMIVMMNLPNVAYVALAHFSSSASLSWIASAVLVEQFGYGFGFAAYMLVMLAYVRDSEYKAAEYSIGTSLMTLGIIVPSLPSGFLCTMWGYESFFVFACLAALPGMVCAAFLKDLDR